ncbi:MAG: Type I restriction-modification system, DNA-methyltransferase subunit M [uncultured Truepera sp.]|uniref:site-specific DNA-methyltransferase (adenine-specific) n=1 Tax=uncultured Truepera sp. TaxID=543023 RepID=A0A6J4VNW0_9DEIN|nr:MAG: Type I restriction-modification system, DNA-methyltransferase subunit M [uncultured Truepera sp.]
MLTGEIRNQVDRIWDAFWTGGISNPLEVIEQLTYLLFIKRLDELHTLAESRATRLGLPLENPVFPTGKTPNGRDYSELRWSRFKNDDPREMYTVITEDVFPFIRTLTGEGTAFSKHIKDARFTLPPEKAGLLARVVDLLEKVPMDDRDTKGDLYEYLLSKLSSAGQNGQFRTPRHIIKLMVDMMHPTPDDTICDPACGTAGFLVAAAEYLYTHDRGEIFGDAELKRRYDGPMFHGFDFDSTMLRVASMNLLLHGVTTPVVKNKDSLSEDHGAEESLYTLILANPPFKGSLDYETTAKDLLELVKTKKTELLFVALFLRLLKTGGRAAAIVPDGVLFGSSNAHKELRRTLVEEHKLEAIVSMPSGVFKPYAGVSTAIMIFTKTGTGGTDDVWFYDMHADGYSLDDKRTPLDPSKHENNNLPDIVRRWENRVGEFERARTEQSFRVPKSEIAANGYDLSINRYKEVAYAETAYDPPGVILDELAALELEIQDGLEELRGMLN